MLDLWCLSVASVLRYGCEYINPVKFSFLRIIKGSVTTQDKIIDTMEIIRKRSYYPGYIHFKIMLGCNMSNCTGRCSWRIGSRLIWRDRRVARRYCAGYDTQWFGLTTRFKRIV